MSNKVLAYTLIAVILAFAGAVFGWRMYSNSQEKLVVQDQKENSQNMQNSNEQTQNQTANQDQNQQASSVPACVRDFDSEKLKTAKVDINNREVEIDVKNFGKIKLSFYEKDAPKTVENFLRLANSGYFDCITFHRVAKGFVIQGGDPTGTGSGGDSAFGGKFADELNPNTQSYKDGYKKGVLAMANSGPNTNSSQFFIMLGDVSLPNNYTIFGKVSEGMEIVDKIGQVDITPVMGPTDGSPKTPVVMQSVKIIK
jgi:cyclophilin family peptidyl-prolyl cis-trans isomerase